MSAAEPGWDMINITTTPPPILYRLQFLEPRSVALVSLHNLSKPNLCTKSVMKIKSVADPFPRICKYKFMIRKYFSIEEKYFLETFSEHDKLDVRHFCNIEEQCMP